MNAVRYCVVFWVEAVWNSLLYMKNLVLMKIFRLIGVLLILVFVGHLAVGLFLGAPLYLGFVEQTPLYLAVFNATILLGGVLPIGYYVRKYGVVEVKSQFRNPSPKALFLLVLIAFLFVVLSYPLSKPIEYLENLLAGEPLPLFRKRSGAYLFIHLVGLLFLAPVLEELLFRGILLKNLLDCYAPPIAIFISGFVFATIHLRFSEFLFLLPLGVLCGVIYFYTQNVLQSIIFHALVNGFIQLFSYRETVSAVKFYYEPLFLLIFLMGAWVIYLCLMQLKCKRRTEAISISGES